MTHGRHRVALWGFALAVIVSGWAGRAGAQEVVADINFAGTIQPHAGAGTVYGRLPVGWGHDGGTRFRPRFSVHSEEQRNHLEVFFDDGGRGSLALYHELPQHLERSVFRMWLRARADAERMVVAGVRTRTPPHNYLAITEVRLDGEWREIEVEFADMPAATERIELFIEMIEGGRYNLDFLRLDRRGRLEVMAEALLTSPVAVHSNLLRMTRFPLGIQTGMSLDRNLCDGDQLVVDGDRGVIGPSGAPALRITSSRDFYLYFEPFAPVLRMERHYAGLQVRGKGDGRLIVVADGRRLASVPFSAAPNRWQRVGLVFDPAADARTHALMLEGRGMFWVDALQVSQGTAETPYTSQLAAEVALAFPNGDAAPARVQFEDEPAELRFAVTGNVAGARLRARVADLYGRGRELEPIPLTASFLNEGRLRYDVFRDGRLGSFRVEAWVEQNGREVSPVYEIVAHRLRRPRHWGNSAPESPFGIHTSPTRRHLLMAKAAGMNWVRLQDGGLPYIGWHHLEPRRGEWTFRDDGIERFRRHGFSILGSFSTAPEWASHIQALNDAHFDRFYQPRDLEAFANYVRMVAARYRDSITHWDVWNEPWSPSYWAVAWSPEGEGRGYVTSEQPARDFARLQERAFKAAMEANPTARIVGVNTPAEPRGREWLWETTASGALESSHIVGAHVSAGGILGYAGDAIEQRLADVIEPLRARVGDGEMPPIWLIDARMAEERVGNGLYRHTVPGDSGEDPVAVANKVQRFLVSALSAGAEKVFLHTMRDHRYFGEAAQWRALVTEEGFLHPSAAAVSALAWRIDGKRFVERYSPADGVYVHLFSNNERSVAAIMSREVDGSEWLLPSAPSLQWTDFLGNPINGEARLASTMLFASFDGGAGELRKRLSGPFFKKD